MAGPRGQGSLVGRCVLGAVWTPDMGRDEKKDTGGTIAGRKGDVMCSEVGVGKVCNLEFQRCLVDLVWRKR